MEQYACVPFPVAPFTYSFCNAPQGQNSREQMMSGSSAGLKVRKEYA